MRDEDKQHCEALRSYWYLVDVARVGDAGCSGDFRPIFPLKFRGIADPDIMRSAVCSVVWVSGRIAAESPALPRRLLCPPPRRFSFTAFDVVCFFPS